jgi:alkaline phosphatase
MSNKVAIDSSRWRAFLAFIGLGILFYANWVVQKPFAIILFLTDNLTTSTLAAARIYQNGADNRLNLEKLPNLGLITTHGGFRRKRSCGRRPPRLRQGPRSIIVRGGGRFFRKPLTNVFDLARQHGRATGLITNAAISDTTPAAFLCPVRNPRDSTQIAEAACRGPLST